MRDARDAAESHVSTQREGGHLQTKERGIGEASFVDTLILDLWFLKL